MGKSGAGKSTAALLSAEIGLPVIADELTFVISDATHNYRLAGMPTVKLPPEGWTAIRPPLRGIFHLVQDTTNYLEPLSQRQTARLLFEGMMQTPSVPKLPDAMVGDAFRTASDIARTIPGYTLHFRKSPDFWKIIDAEFDHD